MAHLPSVAHQIAARDFGARAVAKLAKAGVEFVGMQPIPDMSSPLPYANAERGYVVSIQGCGHVLVYREVLKLIEGGAP